jgi:hypothetical protein
MKRRLVITSVAATPLAFWLSRAGAAAPLPPVQVFKSPTCGCCGAWVEHLEAAGFPVRVTEVDDTTAARKRLGMPDRLGSCHTATVAGYVLEGHVPAADVTRLLADRPPALGLAVPGMPVGSPGMEGPNARPYDVVTFDKQGRSEVFATHGR